VTQAAFDAVLLLAFGGPDRMEDVRPFLGNVLAGRPVPPERIEEVVHHYEVIGGRSPLRSLTEAQRDALATELQRRGIAIPIHIGMRHWHPYIAETLETLVQTGSQRVLAVIMSALDSDASKKAYQVTLDAALLKLGDRAPKVEYAPGFATQPGFANANAEGVQRALDALGTTASESRLIFTAHSIPEAMAARSPYVQQLEAIASAVALQVNKPGYRIAYQSRSGSPREPWLEPDILSVMREEHAAGTRAVVVAPVGFVCDHVEVLFDLDIEAKALADELRMGFARAATANAHPMFIAALADVIERSVRGS
jgi:protoporphyrin/coproporphyrin ferrochelatase